MKKRPTIKTIAEIAGVSHAAVSRALRGYPDISPQTTARIRKIAEEIGYTPNVFARNLAGSHTHTLGMIIPSTGINTIYNEVYADVSIFAAERGYSVFLGNSNRDRALEKTYCRLMCENRVGALIIAPSASDISHIREACKGAPAIFIGGKVGLEEEYSISVNYRHSAELAVAHLHSLGHRDIVLGVYAPENQTIRQKIEGFTASMESRGLMPRVCMEGDSENTLLAGEALAARLSEHNALPTAIWCASDLMAIGMLSGLRKLGLRVPEDISVMGHDDLPFSTFPGTDLTTLRTPRKALALHALHLAVALTEGKDEGIAHTALYQAELVIRKTTRPL